MTTAYGGERTGMGHRKHPLLGQQVVDTAHGCRIGVLRAVAPELDLNPKPGVTSYQESKDRAEIDTAPCVAWLAPPEGGVEWHTDVGAIEKA